MSKKFRILASVIGVWLLLAGAPTLAEETGVGSPPATTNSTDPGGNWFTDIWNALFG